MTFLRADEKFLDKPYLEAFKHEKGYITDSRLKELAVKKRVIPKNWKKEINLVYEVESGNSIIAWIVMDRKSKFEMVNLLKRMYKEEDVDISKTTAFYVNEIDAAIYNMIRGRILYRRKWSKSVGVMIKTIALMSGDFEDHSGRGEAKLLNDWLGDGLFKEFTKIYPEKSKKLLPWELDNSPYIFKDPIFRLASFYWCLEKADKTFDILYTSDIRKYSIDGLVGFHNDIITNLRKDILKIEKMFKNYIQILNIIKSVQRDYAG